MNKDKEKQLITYLDLADKAKQTGDYKTAIEYYEKFIELDNSKSVVYTITADLYEKAYGDLSIKKQIEYYEKAFYLKPSRLAIHGLAFGYEKIGDYINAKKYYEILLQNNPTETDLYNYGLFLIHAGNLYEGHKYITNRFNINDINLKYPIQTAKRWDLKTDIKNKILLVHYEQGFGDTIMYCRFIPFLKDFAKRIIFVVQDELYDLIKNSTKISSDIEIISDKTNIESIDYDVDMALLDIPYVLKTEISNIPFAEGYLEVSQKNIEDFRKKYLESNNKTKIGIANSGSKDSNYKGRDIDLTEFSILQKQNLEIFYLQKDISIDNSNIINLGAEFNDFTQTASAIRNMDLIISTDNVILNLAGALGVKTIGLFNKDTNYRWFKTNGNDTGWYKSVKPLQAQVQNDWTPVMNELANLIE